MPNVHEESVGDTYKDTLEHFQVVWSRRLTECVGSGPNKIIEAFLLWEQCENLDHLTSHMKIRPRAWSKV
jgi:hypothetical protein